jgi:N-acetylmuramoyl-L-alanine amidase
MGILMLTLLGNDAVTVMSENARLETQRCIIIDAGHGGVDGGATSCSGVLESQINLQIALRLDDLLHLLGYRTEMIRTEDISVYTQGETIAAKKISDLKERVRIVNSKEEGILVSIHQNYFSDSRYSGAQVFYPKTEGSERLAKDLQRSIVSSLNVGSNRQAKPVSGVYLMEHIQNTGILIECGFISNPEEDANLRSAQYQKKLCCVIAASIGKFLLS